MATKFPVLTGVNITGAEWEWKSTVVPKEGTDYLFISQQDADYIASKGFNFGRFLFSWELLQPALNGALDTASYGTTLKSRVDYLTNTKKLYIMVEPHGASSPNFIRYKGNLVGSSAVPISAFADFWKRMALLYKDNPRVIFGLGNEPNNMSTVVWYQAAQAAITAIRSTGATNFIMVEGNGWSQPDSWNDNWYDTATTKVSNAVGWSTLHDPLNNTIVSVHSYFDTDGGGGTDAIVSTDILAKRLQTVVTWARSKGLKVHLSEFGANAATAGAQTAVDTTCKFLQANSDVIIGWSWWAYGPPSWWGGYRFTLCPKNNYATDDPKIAWLKPYMAPIQNPADFTGTAPSPAPTPAPTGSEPTNPIPFTKNIVFTQTTSLSNYWAFVPNSYDTTHKTPMKLFVWLHGCGGKSQYDVEMVSPGGTTQSWISVAPGGREGQCWSDVNTDGPKILAAISDIRTKFNIDPRQIFLGGYSSGGDIGYPLMFRNASLFAGGLFENTAPSSAALTDANSASWKVNVAHLAHTSDTTYPIASVRSAMSSLQSKGFPVTLIEKPGTHWDNDVGTTGTTYDLKTYLLPYLNAGWMQGSTGTVPQPTPTPTPSPSLNIVPTSTTVPCPGDQGKNFSKIVGTGQAVPSGTYYLKTTTRATYSDQNSFSVQITLINSHTNVDITWENMVVDTRGHKIQSTWGATVSAPDANGLVTVTPSADAKTVLAGNRTGFGFYAVRNSDPTKANYQVLVKSVKW